MRAKVEVRVRSGARARDVATDVGLGVRARARDVATDVGLGLELGLGPGMWLQMCSRLEGYARARVRQG